MASLQISPVPLLPARNGFPRRRPRMAAVSCKFDQSTSIQGTRLRNNITRRDTLSFMSAAMLAAFLVVAPAEARTSRLENKKKSMEKLKKIREKALAPKEKDGGSAMDLPPANLFADHLFVPPPVVIAFWSWFRMAQLCG